MIQTKKDVFQLEAEINDIKRESRELTEANFNKLIQENWDRLKRIVAEESLKKMPVDTISTLEKGMPINRLVGLGFETIYDIKDQTVEDLMMIEGIGEIGARAIHESVSKIKSSVVQEARPTINPDRLSAEEIALLNSIYTKRELLEDTESLQKDIATFNQQIAEPLQSAKNQKGFVGRLFQAKNEKEKVRRAIGILNEPIHKESLHNLRDRVTNILQFKVDQDALKQHFITTDKKTPSDSCYG